MRYFLEMTCIVGAAGLVFLGSWVDPSYSKHALGAAIAAYLLKPRREGE